MGKLTYLHELVYQTPTFSSVAPSIYTDKFDFCLVGQEETLGASRSSPGNVILHE